MNLPGASLVVHLTETDSTQTQARKLAEQGCPDKTVVWADVQTAGRGRLERTWSSPPGNLYFSAVLRPTFAPAALAAYGLAAAESIALALREHAGVETAVKPPNDVYALKDGEARKISGILAEAAGGQSSVDWLVVGVGVNVNKVPPKLPGATCLKCLTKKDWDVEKVLAAVWSRLKDAA
jgi:BirA family transcriptional regulator, biotin operon repressor / biotin---[acetyl-CoA-carboxylase] ligase